MAKQWLDAKLQSLWPHIFLSSGQWHFVNHQLWNLHAIDIPASLAKLVLSLVKPDSCRTKLLLKLIPKIYWLHPWVNQFPFGQSPKQHGPAVASMVRVLVRQLALQQVHDRDWLIMKNQIYSWQRTCCTFDKRLQFVEICCQSIWWAKKFKLHSS